MVESCLHFEPNSPLWCELRRNRCGLQVPSTILYYIWNVQQLVSHHAVYDKFISSSAVQTTDPIKVFKKQTNHAEEWTMLLDSGGMLLRLVVSRASSSAAIVVPQPQQFRSFFTGIRSIIKDVFTGDDHVNPKKLLERQYIYRALLALQFRDLRRNNNIASINHNNSNNNNNNHHTAAAPDLDLDQLYEQTVQELEAKELDRMTNVQLRQTLQNALRPQVIEIFQAFHRVDETLALQEFHGFVVSSDGGLEDAPSRMNLDPLFTILEQERAQVQEQIQILDAPGRASPGSDGFYERKREALDTLLMYHESGQMKNGASDCIIDAFGMNMRTIPKQRLPIIRCYQTLNMARAALIRDELGYSVVTLQSSIPGAGRGVFLDGTALAGTLVAFQPGEVWSKEHLLTRSIDVMKHFEGEDDCQVSLRFDEYVVDSRESPVTVLTREGSLNPWAVGHMINHPPHQVEPNCLSTTVNFTKRMKLDHLIKYIPNTYARGPGWQSRFFDAEETLMHGLGLTTTRDTSNEELLYDYRLQSEETPSWYSVVEYEDDAMNDDQVVFFRNDWNQKGTK